MTRHNGKLRDASNVNLPRRPRLLPGLLSAQSARTKALAGLTTVLQPFASIRRWKGSARSGGRSGGNGAVKYLIYLFDEQGRLCGGMDLSAHRQPRCGSCPGKKFAG